MQPPIRPTHPTDRRLPGARNAPQSPQPIGRPPSDRAARPGRSAAPSPMQRTVTLSGRNIPYTLKVSARARRLRLVIRPESGLEVVVPRGAPPAAHEPFLREKERWILATLDRMASVVTAGAPEPLVDDRALPFAGRELRLALSTGGTPGRFRVSLNGDVLTLTLPTDDQEMARMALGLWYRKQAPAIFAERLRLANQRYQFTYGRVSVKEQKSRWGSCSKLGNLNFNWRLLLAPLAVLDYVVVHELCHLKEMNHGPRFWKLVALGCPDYAVHRRWLRQHGNELRI